MLPPFTTLDLTMSESESLWYQAEIFKALNTSADIEGETSGLSVFVLALCHIFEGASAQSYKGTPG